MSARERILARVRAGASHACAAPPPFAPSPRRADFAAFGERLADAGGEPCGPFAVAELGARVAERCRAWAGAGRVLASAAARARLGDGPWREVPAAATPRDFADVAVAVFVGALGVAENGAVGLDGREAAPRVLPVLCERLILLLDVGCIVPEMHAALGALTGDAFAHHHFTFVAGPSKTADIEGALVLGAHGPRALAVFGFEP